MLSTMVTISLGGNVLADGRVDVVAERGGLFDAGAGAGADVNLELAGVDGGEEVLAEQGGEKAHGGQREDEEEDEEDAGVIDAQGEQAQVADAEFLEAGSRSRVESG